MKKLLLLFALVVSAATSVIAQNANRSGIFLEAGSGFLIGSAPYTKIEWKNNSLTSYRAGGPDINLAVGYRGATSSVFAWGIKAELSAAPGSFDQTMVIAFMPGVRFTTRELFGNTSLYFGFDAGFAIGRRQEDYTTIFYPEGLDASSERQFDLESGFESFGAKFSLSAGFNFTSSFYGGLYWDYNVLSKQIFSLESLKKDGTTNNWGSVGIRLGYRF